MTRNLARRMSPMSNDLFPSLEYCSFSWPFLFVENSVCICLSASCRGKKVSALRTQFFAPIVARPAVVARGISRGGAHLLVALREAHPAEGKGRTAALGGPDLDVAAVTMDASEAGGAPNASV